ncbi:MAG TPA: hypothetical protein VKG25_11155, partial [Bryobacteraceae bacterium]|nr:hypothetical protein [Bryobacteraceae bacterium]
MKQLGIALTMLAVVAAAFLVGSSFRKAEHILNTARTGVAHENQVDFRRYTLDKTVVSPFEPVSAPAQFRDAAFFEGHLYLCGP